MAFSSADAFPGWTISSASRSASPRKCRSSGRFGIDSARHPELPAHEAMIRSNDGAGNLSCTPFLLGFASKCGKKRQSRKGALKEKDSFRVPRIALTAGTIRVILIGSPREVNSYGNIISHEDRAENQPSIRAEASGFYPLRERRDHGSAGGNA